MSEEGAVAAVSLDQVRSRIDAIDRQIVDLLGQRQACVMAAGLLKKDEQSVRAPARVEQVIAKVRTLAADAEVSPDVVDQTYRALIAGFIDLELEAHRS